jgi:riboflavin synthase
MRKLQNETKRIGVVDTMFARIDMGAIVLAALATRQGQPEPFEVIRTTVPGFKDLGVAAKRLIENEGCHIVIACGMPGGARLDRLCTHEASLTIAMAQLMTTTPILEIFVHEEEAMGNETKLVAICHDRCSKHALNAHDMLFAPETLVARAGKGVRQGYADAGPIALAEQGA